MPSKPNWQEAIVLSGGGALGAFEVGVMKALYEGRSPVTDFRPVNPNIFTGTSVGAYNATFLAALGSQASPQSISWLQDVWLREIADTPTSCGTQAFRLRTAPFTLDPACLANPLQLFVRGLADTTHWAEYAVSRSAAFLTSKETLPVRCLETINLESLISPEPLYELIRRTISLDSLRRSDIDVAIAATNWRDGKLVIFKKQNLQTGDGLRAVAASAAIPGVFPPVELQGVPFIDGAVLLNTPIKPAIDCGADVLHVIYLDPEVSRIPVPPVANTLATLLRTFAIILAKNTNADIRNAGEIVGELRSLRRRGILQEDFRTLSADAPEEVRSVRRIREGKKPPFKPLTIHRYRPRTALGSSGGFIDFRQDEIRHLIERGFENAVHHDCEQEECVLAEVEISQAKGEHHA